MALQAAVINSTSQNKSFQYIVLSRSLQHIIYMFNASPAYEK